MKNKEEVRWGLWFALAMYVVIGYGIYRFVWWILDKEFAYYAVAVWSVAGWFLTEFWESWFNQIFRIGPFKDES